MTEVSEKFLKYGLMSSYKGIMPDPDGHSVVKGECGDTIEFFIEVQEDTIVSIKYDIDGCVNSNACVNAIIDMSKGKSFKKVLEISANDIDNFLETLPEKEFHCAEMVVEAIREAIKDFAANRNMSWKKQYKKTIYT